MPGMTLHQRLRNLDVARLRGMKRGIEKEGLRVAPDGTLARTPHPVALGSALTHLTLPLESVSHSRVTNWLAWPEPRASFSQSASG